MFDPDLSFPQGQSIQWHAGYDLPVAGAVVALCGPRPGRDCLETTAALGTPVLGVIATLLVFLLGRAAAGPIHGLVAAALFAIYPFSAGSGAIGHVDHHVLEPLLVAAVLWALARKRHLVAGVIAGLSFAVFPSALLPFTAITAALALNRLYKLRQGIRRDRGPLGFALCALVVLIPVVLTGAFAGSWEPAATSLFHLAALVAAVLLLTCLEVAAGLESARSRLALLGPAVLVCAAGLLAGRDNLLVLSRFGLGRASELWTGVQHQPLARGSLAIAILVAIVLGSSCLTVSNGWRRGLDGLALAGLTACPLALLGVWQIRFLTVASPPIALAIAHLLMEARALLIDGLADHRRRTRLLGRLTFSASVLLALVPAREYLRPQPGPRCLRDGTRLLRRFGQTVVRAPGDPVARSRVAGAVLSDWTWGHHILYFTGLPTVASPFILSGRDRANVEARRALLGEQPEGLYRTMMARRCRYLMVSSGFFDPAMVAASLKEKAPGNPAALQLMAGQIIGWSRLKLLALEPCVRLYELVAGARLTGFTTPRTAVEAVLELRSRSGERIELSYQTFSGPEGGFELLVPQPTGPLPDGALVAGQYRVLGREIPVTVQQVDEGQQVRVPQAER